MLTKTFLVAILVVVLFENTQSSPHIKEPPQQVDDDNFVNGPFGHVQDDENVVIGDMILPKKKSLSNNPKHQREKRTAYSTDFKWPKVGSTVTIPYTKSGVNDKVLQRAIEVFNAKTCIRFVPRSSQSNYVSFLSGSACNTAVGYRNSGSQTISLTSGCASKKGKVMHEMMHTLGFMHEHCRPDRDNYVTVHSDNIISGAEPNFAIQSESVDQSIPYDCDSILHYPSNYASSNGQDTITSSHCSALGNGDTRLSLKDYKRVNTLYSCDNPTYENFTVRVVTDSSWTSGTDCFIYIKLHGSSRTSGEFELDIDNAGSSNLFESGSDDTFSKMAFRNDLGTITGISIRMVSNGSGEGWWPNTFTVTDPVNSQTKTFTNSQWLSPSSTYGSSEFPASS